MLAPKSLLLLAGAALSSAARLVVSIPSSQLLPNPSTLPSSTHAILLGPPGVRYDAPIRRDNTFVFDDIPDASYLLTLQSRDHFFPPLRVDVTKAPAETAQTISAWQTFRGNEWSNKGPSYGTGKGDLIIAVNPIAQKDFYMVRGGFNLLSFFKNPMILMALGSGVLIFGMPYIMDNSMLKACGRGLQRYANLSQWILRPRPSLRRCRRRVRLWAAKALRISFRISILLAGWPDDLLLLKAVRVLRLVEEGRRSDTSSLSNLRRFANSPLQPRSETFGYREYLANSFVLLVKTARTASTRFRIRIRSVFSDLLRRVTVCFCLPI